MLADLASQLQVELRSCSLAMDVPQFFSPGSMSKKVTEPVPQSTGVEFVGGFLGYEMTSRMKGREKMDKIELQKLKT